MSPDQEHRLEKIFSAARDLPPLEREAFLERACGGDAQLRQAADSLLSAHEQAGQFLQPTVALPIPDALAGKSGDRINSGPGASQCLLGPPRICGKTTHADVLSPFRG